MKGPMASFALAISFVLPVAQAQTPTVSPDSVPDVLVREHRIVLPKVAPVEEDYARNCQGCHGHEGHSVVEVPRLQGRAGWFTHTSEGRAYLVQVPNVLQSNLTDERLAAMLNWMLTRFSGEQLRPDFRPYTAAEVHALRAQRLESVIARRREVVDGLVRAGVIPDATALAFSLEPGRY